jgi:hypothetical protein
VSKASAASVGVTLEPVGEIRFPTPWWELLEAIFRRIWTTTSKHSGWSCQTSQALFDDLETTPNLNLEHVKEICLLQC